MRGNRVAQMQKETIRNSGVGWKPGNGGRGRGGGGGGGGGGGDQMEARDRELCIIYVKTGY